MQTARVFASTFENQTVAAASGDYDIWQLLGNALRDGTVAIRGLTIAVTSELGDSAEEMARIKIIRGYTGAAGGTIASEVPLIPGNTFGGTVRYLDSTPLTAGSPVDVHSDAFNVRFGYRFFPEPEMTQQYARAAAGTWWVVRLEAAFVDDVSMSSTLYYEETA